MPFPFPARSGTENCPTPSDNVGLMANNKYGEKYTRELLTEAVANSISIAGVLRYLEIPMAGGTHAHISRKLKQFGIDTSHFLGQARTCGSSLLPDDSPQSRLLLPESRAHGGRSLTCYAGHCARVAYRMPARPVASRPSGTASR